MGKKLGCHFVGHREKTEKSRCSSAPSCPFDTAALLPEQRKLSGMVPHFFRRILAKDKCIARNFYRNKPASRAVLPQMQGRQHDSQTQ